MSFNDVLVDIPFDKNNKRNKKKKTYAKKTVVVETSVDSSDIKYIKEAISSTLMSLYGNLYTRWFIIKVLPTKENCYRASVYSKENRKCLNSFHVEKASPSEYVFSPPLDIKAFTTESYENRNIFDKKSS